MRWIGGHEQDRLPRMLRRQVQGQSTGDRRLPHPALSDNEGQLSHREIVCGTSEKQFAEAFLGLKIALDLRIAKIAEIAKDCQK